MPGQRHREERTMSHDKIKAAARKRIAENGEPYVVARREDIREHTAARRTSPLSPEDIRAAAEAHRELGPEYGDAVVASFIDKVDREVAARVEARLAGMPRAQSAKPSRRGHLVKRRARDVLAASAGALVVASALGLHGIISPHTAPPARSLPAPQIATVLLPQLQGAVPRPLPPDILWLRVVRGAGPLHAPVLVPVVATHSQ